MRFVPLVVAMVLLAACEDTTPVCVVGETSECDCPTGGRGEQVCSADGLSLGSCVCTVDAGAGDASDDAAAVGDDATGVGVDADAVDAGSD